MIKTKTPDVSPKDLANRIASITVNLEGARADVALLQRLKDAQANAKRLTLELQATQEVLASALADERNAKLEAEFANIRKMAISTSVPPEDRTAGVLKTTFAVTYETLSYDYQTRQNVWRTVSAPGINYLQARELAYLTQAKPELIPQCIVDLAPGQPAEAVSRYIQAMSRGYLTQ